MKTEPEKRTSNVKVPMTETEFQTIKTAAHREGMPVAVFMRTLALRAARGER